MSSLLSVRVAFFLLIAVLFPVDIAYRAWRDRHPSTAKRKYPRYLPYVSGITLPIFVLIGIPLFLLLENVSSVFDFVVMLCLTVFLNVSIYSILMVLLMPLFRKHLSARICGILWLLPLDLLLFVNHTAEPVYILHLPYNGVVTLVGIWSIGFLAVLGYHIYTHLRFQKELLASMEYVNNRQILQLWEQAQEEANIKLSPFSLRISAKIQTPLSIGFRRKKVTVFLPKQGYTQQQLQLIFRHELIHICRRDSLVKFSMIFFKAMCWFNPLMWYAVRQCANDFECSCDETVLLNADDAQRRVYADLLLRTAGDDRGFTTCLSASAKNVRDRLQVVMKPKKWLLGSLLVGILSFAVLMSFGTVALAYDGLTGEQVIFQGQDPAKYTVFSVSWNSSEGIQNGGKCRDSQALNQYLSTLSLTKRNTLTDDSAQLEKNDFEYAYHTPDGILFLRLQDKFLKVTRLHSTLPTGTRDVYQINSKVDWDYIDSLLYIPQKEAPLPYPPVMYLIFDEPQIHEGSGPLCVDGTVTSISATFDGIPELYRNDSTCGISGASVTQATLSFSHELHGNFHIRVESMDGSDSYELASSTFDEDRVLPLAPYSANYTVTATLQSHDAIYETEFRFFVELP